MGLAAVGSALLNVDSWRARRILGLPTDYATRLPVLLCAAACGLSVLRGASGTAGATGLALAVAYWVILVRHPEGCDSADAMIACWLWLASVSLVTDRGIGLLGIQVMYGMIFGLSGLQKLRSHSWRSGLPFTSVRSLGYVTWIPTATIRRLDHLPGLVPALVTFQLATPVALLLPQPISTVWFLLCLTFHIAIALGTSIWTFLVCALTIAPIWLFQGPNP